METPQYLLLQKHAINYFWGNSNFLGVTEFAFLPVFGFSAGVRKSQITGWILDTGWRMLDAGFWILDNEYWILYTGNDCLLLTEHMTLLWGTSENLIFFFKPTI